MTDLFCILKIKGNTLKCVYMSLGVLMHMSKCSMKPRVAPEDAACNRINCFQLFYTAA